MKELYTYTHVVTALKWVHLHQQPIKLPMKELYTYFIIAYD